MKLVCSIYYITGFCFCCVATICCFAAYYENVTEIATGNRINMNLTTKYVAENWLKYSKSRHLGYGNYVIKKFFGRTDLWQPRGKGWGGSSTPASYASAWYEVGQHASRFIPTYNSNATIADVAVVHLRCSDVPFTRHPSYHLLPKAYFKFAAGAIKAAGLSQVRILLCIYNTSNVALTTKWNGAYRSPQFASEKCQTYAAAILGWLQNESLQVEKQPVCADRRSALAMMGACGVLVSTGGSFSFIAGVGKPKGAFVSPRFAHESDRTRGTSGHQFAQAVHWEMWTGDPIWHANVKDYKTFDYEAYLDASGL